MLKTLVSTRVQAGGIVGPMTIRKIARMGHPVLCHPAAAVEDPTEGALKDLVLDMIETMADAQGVGLAAPQVYESRRLVVFHEIEEPSPDEEEAQEQAGAPLIILINPQIEILTDETIEDWEGCLSVPGLRGLVPRYTHLRYSGVDPEGHLIEREARGFHARVVQHECDHLDGILYPQRMTNLSKLIFETESRHWDMPPDDELV